MHNKIKKQFEDIFNNILPKDVVKNYLIKLYNDGETSEQIAAAASTMREHLIPANVSEALRDKLIDNCGTGGDNSNSFNISTTVSIILASCGCSVAKHGNRSISSKSGSADMLEALGVNLELSVHNQINMLKKVGFAFMFALNHHPAMKHIMPIRKEIPHRTIFNILGPLSNPAFVKKQLIGVFHKDYVIKIAQALVKLDTNRAFVVSSEDGMDEISISDITHCAFVENTTIKEFILDPREFGFKLYDKSEIEGGDANTNALITKNILNGSLKGAKRDIVVLNSAVALFVDEKVFSIEEGIKLVNKSIDNKSAINKLNQIIKVSNNTN